MIVRIINEDCAYIAAFGNALSFGKTSGMAVDSMSADMAQAILEKAADYQVGRGGGHDKFLRMITIHADITAPLYWWKQFDTYKVGTTALSESTMHTLMKTKLDQSRFEDPINPLYLFYLRHLQKKGHFHNLNNALPQGFLQRRIVCMNYAVVNNILEHRENHKLPQWRKFCSALRSQLSYKNLLF